jgi:predicted peptidase
MYRIISCLSFLICISFSSVSQKMDLFEKLLYVNHSDSLPYRMLKPLAAQSHDSLPLVIFLHGAGERGNDNDVQVKHITELFLSEKNRTKFPCYVIAPQCPKGEYWARYDGEIDKMRLRKNPTTPMKLVIELIDQVCNKYAIDKSRIYITGLSMGGFGTWDLIARFPDKFAAAVPICGGGDAHLAGQIKHIPLWAFHGSKDNIVAPQHSRKMIQALQALAALPGYTEYPDVEHNSWEYAYREPMLLEWLFKQKKHHIGKH